MVARTAIGAASRRNFSIRTSMRQFARSFQPKVGVHHNPVVHTHVQAGDWAKQARRLGGQFAIYFPTMGVILGWPALTKAFVYGW